jgi:MAPEG family
MKPIPSILPVYAAILALVFVVLSIRTIRQRRKLKIGLGDAGNKDLQRAVRVHANLPGPAGGAAVACLWRGSNQRKFRLSGNRYVADFHRTAGKRNASALGRC